VFHFLLTHDVAATLPGQRAGGSHILRRVCLSLNDGVYVTSL